MARFEENRAVVDGMIEMAKRKPTGTYEEMVTFQLGTIATMLAEISKSLAILADKVESEDKEVENVPSVGITEEQISEWCKAHNCKIITNELLEDFMKRH